MLCRTIKKVALCATFFSIKNSPALKCAGLNWINEIILIVVVISNHYTTNVDS